MEKGEEKAAERRKNEGELEFEVVRCIYGLMSSGEKDDLHDVRIQMRIEGAMKTSKRLISFDREN